MAIIHDGSPRSSRRSDLTPEIKTGTGITYAQFSVTLGKLAYTGDNFTAARRREFKELLFSSVRLREWISNDTGKPKSHYQIFNIEKNVRVEVTADAVYLTRYTPNPATNVLAEGIDATALLLTLTHGNAVLDSLLPVDQSPDEEFFRDSATPEGAILDSVFDEEGTQSSKKNKLASEEESYVDKCEPKQMARTMMEPELQRHVKSLQGRILTIADASISDKQQREAVKTLMNKEFRREMEKIAYKFMNPDTHEIHAEDQ